jgi:hypothetical protein
MWTWHILEEIRYLGPRLGVWTVVLFVRTVICLLEEAFSSYLLRWRKVFGTQKWIWLRSTMEVMELMMLITENITRRG